MKIVDEKGRIFGKLNIIDLLVLVLLIAAVAFVGLKLTGRNGNVAGAGSKLTYTVEVDTVFPQVYEEIKAQIPGQLMANGSLLDGYVTNVTAIPHVNYGVDSNGQAQVSTEENGRLDLVFTIEANVTNTVINEVGTQEVRVGKTHIVKTTGFELINGTILTLKSEPLA